jgi:hypothetical protein
VVIILNDELDTCTSDMMTEICALLARLIFTISSANLGSARRRERFVEKASIVQEGSALAPNAEGKDPV